MPKIARSGSDKRKSRGLPTGSTELLAPALSARSHAYAPYSGFAVGASVVDENGRVFVGCNVENASYGATLCAERNAIAAMVASGGNQVQAICIVTDTPNGVLPCGLCRQVLVELAAPEAKVWVATTRRAGNSRPTAYSVRALAPFAFTRKDLSPTVGSRNRRPKGSGRTGNVRKQTRPK